jgi:hypothetical protein
VVRGLSDQEGNISVATFLTWFTTYLFDHDVPGEGMGSEGPSGAGLLLGAPLLERRSSTRSEGSTGARGLGRSVTWEDETPIRAQDPEFEEASSDSDDVEAPVITQIQRSLDELESGTGRLELPQFKKLAEAVPQLGLKTEREVVTAFEELAPPVVGDRRSSASRADIMNYAVARLFEEVDDVAWGKESDDDDA